MSAVPRAAGRRRVGAVEVRVAHEERVGVPERGEHFPQRRLDRPGRSAWSLGGLDAYRYQRSASAPCAFDTAQGSTMFPFDFDIFSPCSSTMCPSTITFLKALVVRRGRAGVRARAPRRGVGEQRAERVEAVEPAAGLVDGLADVVRGELRREACGSRFSKG